jgi:uncharacterized protein with PIN domain
VRFRFQGELNDFLTSSMRDRQFEHSAGTTDTLKHLIESLGVPHTELGQVMVNGEIASLSSHLSAGDCIDVFPPIAPVSLDDPRFVIDGHLGRLAAYLRMLGFDCWYEPSADDEQLASTAAAQKRLVLTRDAGLLKRREVDRGYYVRSDNPRRQLRELTNRFAIRSRFAPFTRCMACNTPLRGVAKSEVIDLLPPHTRATKDEFSRCPNCGKIFWRGSHHARMLGWIEELKAD